ncbi:hypothetical protein U1Q18_048118 [Sarracenia purpurea var. burkii]
MARDKSSYRSFFMGNGGNSWLNAVKKAFRSPPKDNNDKRGSRRREANEQEEEDEEEEKKRGKRGWIFRKASLLHETTIHHNISANASVTSAAPGTGTLPANTVAEAADAEQRRAIAVATTAAAQAAVATAQAVVEVIRLTTPSLLVRAHCAAIAIQKAFRGYLVITKV